MLGLIFSAVIITLVFSVLIIVHELGHFFAARMTGVKVEKFAIGFGKRIFKVTSKGTEYVLNLLPLGGYVKLSGEDPYERKGEPGELYSKPALSRLWIFLSGPLYNYVFAFIILVSLYLVGTPKLTSDIGGTLKNSPAEKAGIVAGDTILSIDERRVKYWDEVVRIIRADEDALPLEIEIQRGGRVIELKIVPSVLSAENVFRQKVKFVGIGIAPSERVVIVKSNPFESVRLAADHVWFFTVTTYRGIWLLFTGAMPIKENVGGPIRIVEILARAIKYGPLSVFSIMATISMALAIFNLLPFPVLDGGHILFLIIEKIRRKPLSIKAQERVTNVALVLLISFVIYVSYFDVVRVVTGLRK